MSVGRGRGRGSVDWPAARPRIGQKPARATARNLAVMAAAGDVVHKAPPARTRPARRICASGDGAPGRPKKNTSAPPARAREGRGCGRGARPARFVKRICSACSRFPAAIGWRPPAVPARGSDGPSGTAARTARCPQLQPGMACAFGRRRRWQASTRRRQRRRWLHAGGCRATARRVGWLLSATSSRRARVIAGRAMTGVDKDR